MTMATSALKKKTITGTKPTSSALDRLKKQLSTSTSTSRNSSGFGTAKSAPAVKTSRAATPSIRPQTGFGTGAAASTASSKLAPAQTQAQTAASTFSNYTPAAQQNLSNQLAATTGGAMGVSSSTPSTGLGTANNGTAGTGTAMTPFGKSFTPDSAEMMRNNPDALIAAYYNFIKAVPNGGEQAMSQEMNSERLRLMNVLFGNQSTNAGNFGPYSDFAGNFLDNQRKPGGSYHSSADIVNQLMKYANYDSTKMTEGNLPPPIFNQLYGNELTPDQQADRWISAYSTANSGMMDPYVANARQSQLVALQNQFIAAKGQGKLEGMNFGQYLDEMGFV
jgi:hypothetical protein